MIETARRVAEPRAGGRWVVPAIAGLLGAAVMTVCMGPSLVDPTNIEWLMHADYRLHFLGWHLYQHGPWTLPLGATPLLIWPIGSSIGLTDSMPIVAVWLKLLDPILPVHFQFIGLWLVLSFALQGVFGALLMRVATPKPSLQLLGASLFILSPPLIFRILHPALTAHWLVLAALWLSLKEDADVPSGRLCAAWAILVAASAATQPYIMLMIIVLMLAAHLRQAASAPRRLGRIATHVVIVLAAAALTLWQAGSLMVRSDQGLQIGGFGEWSTNLLAFVMPTEAQSLFSPGPVRYASPGQYEGYAYLGAGMLLLGAIVVIARLASRRPIAWAGVGRHLPLIAALVFLEAMALGQNVTMGSRTLFTYDVDWWGPLKIFRTQGRMVWPLFYATIVVILFAVTRFRYRVALALCILGTLVQAADVSTMSRYVRDLNSWGFRDPLESAFWRIAPPHYRQLVLVPSNLCAGGGYIDDAPFALLAGRYGLGINSGMTARYDVQRARDYCHQLDVEVLGGRPAKESLYIVRPNRLAGVRPPRTSDEARCTVVDGYGVCFAAETYALWQDGFDLVRSRLPPAEEVVRFYDELNKTYGTTLGRPARDVPAALDLRADAVIRYLAYRIEGCDHPEAESKTLRHAAGQQERGLCAAVALRRDLPPADQTLAFTRRLDDALGKMSAATQAQTHVDLEGEAVWLQAYVAERLKGRTAREASNAVVQAVVSAAR